jgi:glutathione S-transferase
MADGVLLYTIPGSHACRSAMLMLEHKGIPWKAREMPPGVQTMTMRARGFPGRTVPAIKVDGTRVQTNRRIARFLDELQPDPPLVPPDRSAEIERAELFGDAVLQTLARRLLLAAGHRDQEEVVDCGDDGRLGPILAYSRWRRRLVVSMAYRFFGLDDELERLDLAALSSVLDQVDSLVAAGTLNGPELNAADFEIAPSLALGSYRLDVRDRFMARPSWALVERLLP